MLVTVLDSKKEVSMFLRQFLSLWISADVFYQAGETEMLYNISRQSNIGFSNILKGGCYYA
jgi:hypothetical protein